MISRFGMLAPLVAVCIWADRKLTIDGCGGLLPRPQMNCSRRGDRQPGIRLAGIQRAPYSTGPSWRQRAPRAAATGHLRWYRALTARSSREARPGGGPCNLRQSRYKTPLLSHGAQEPYARIGNRQDEELDRAARTGSRPS